MVKMVMVLRALALLAFASCELHEPLSDYLDARWVEATVNGRPVLLKVGPDPREPRLAAEQACEATAPDSAHCVDELEAHIAASLERNPSFNVGYHGIVSGTGTSVGDRGVDVDGAPPGVEVTAPAPRSRMASRSDGVVFEWVVRAEGFRVGTDGVACVCVRDEATGASVVSRVVSALEPGAIQRFSVFGLPPGSYAFYAQLRTALHGEGVGGIAIRRTDLVAVAAKTDPAPRAAPIASRPWLRARLAADDRDYEQGRRIDVRDLLDGDLMIVFDYGAGDLAAAVAAVGAVEACAHLGTTVENDVGALLGCVGLAPSTSGASLRVGQAVVAPTLNAAVDRRKIYGVRASGPSGIATASAPLLLLAHAQRIADPPRGASAAASDALAAALAPLPPEASSGYDDLDNLRRCVGPFETHVGGSLDKPRKQRALRDAVASVPGGAVYCETGFNAGYSASAALSAGAETVAAYDTGQIGTVPVALDFLRRAFPDAALTLHVGDSCASLEAAVAANGSAACDVVFVDGGHDLATAECDARLLSLLAKPGAVLVVDDVNPACETDYDPGFCDGPLLAWRRVTTAGLVDETYCDAEGFCVGTYRRRDDAALAALRRDRGEPRDTEWLVPDDWGRSRW